MTVADVKLLSVNDAGGDVLVVKAAVGDLEIEARGWVSATTNHYDDASLDSKTGHRRAGARPRAMTPKEIGAYARRLIVEQHPELSAAKPIAIE
jgi:hypothetical protein